ncbi:hypothetical protein AB0L88_15000 [Saccharopolyspora shandongensis]|uniref:WD40 repeat domain-containing protein n=1 Tax=Saccharopolyspora shandongensis TaxID=418495 RepID=UPI00343C3A96
MTGHPGPITKVAVSPDGSFLATQANGDPDVGRWHPDGGERAVLTGHRSAITNVEISPDGQWLATSSNDGVLRVWAQDGTECSAHNAHNGPIADVAIGPDGVCGHRCRRSTTRRPSASRPCAPIPRRGFVRFRGTGAKP